MVASEKSPANKNMFKVDDRKDARTISVNAIRVSFDYLGTYFTSATTCQSLFLISSCDKVFFSKVSGLYYK